MIQYEIACVIYDGMFSVASKNVKKLGCIKNSTIPIDIVFIERFQRNKSMAGAHYHNDGYSVPRRALPSVCLSFTWVLLRDWIVSIN